MNTTLGAAVVLQVEKAKQILEKITFCDNCFARAWEIGVSLKRCVGCQCFSYCSKQCQRAHWPRHKRFCNLIQGKGAANAFLSSTASDKGEEFVFDLIIDSYRIRGEHDHLYRREDHGIYYRRGNLPDGNVFANGDVEADFQNYLDCAEDAKVLPVWWEFYKRMECLSKAVDRTGNPQNIFTRIDEDGLAERYSGDRQIRCTLILLAELVVGYEGKGAPKGATWINSFKQYVNEPETKKKLEEDSIKSLKAMYAKYGRDFPPASNI